MNSTSSTPTQVKYKYQLNDYDATCLYTLENETINGLVSLESDVLMNSSIIDLVSFDITKIDFYKENRNKRAIFFTFNVGNNYKKSLKIIQEKIVEWIEIGSKIRKYMNTGNILKIDLNKWEIKLKETKIIKVRIPKTYFGLYDLNKIKTSKNLLVLLLEQNKPNRYGIIKSYHDEYSYIYLYIKGL